MMGCNEWFPLVRLPSPNTRRHRWWGYSCFSFKFWINTHIHTRSLSLLTSCLFSLCSLISESRCGCWSEPSSSSSSSSTCGGAGTKGQIWEPGTDSGPLGLPAAVVTHSTGLVTAALPSSSLLFASWNFKDSISGFILTGAAKTNHFSSLTGQKEKKTDIVELFITILFYAGINLNVVSIDVYNHPLHQKGPNSQFPSSSEQR